jgi:hypothetical protein
LVVVAPEDVVALDLDTLVRPDGRWSASVVGVTADGYHVLGLDPTLQADGVDVARGDGSWLFVAPAPPAADADLVATWRGLVAYP